MNKRLLAKPLTDKIYEELKSEISKRERAPKLFIVTVGDDPASKVYVGMKIKKAAEIGIEAEHIVLDSDITQYGLNGIMNTFVHSNCETAGSIWNTDTPADGVILQLPLPKHLCDTEAMSYLDPRIDVDGFGERAIASLQLKRADFLPCTPFGVMKLLDHYGINPSNKVALVIGRSAIVGAPMAKLLQDDNASVMVAHSRTPADVLSNWKQMADITVIADGQIQSHCPEEFKRDSVVIDVNIGRVDGKVCGGLVVDEHTENWISYTPVPGSVGPLTVMTLMSNTVWSAYEQDTLG
jgi:methylenetetrahydrofolate dehydrogenase (NADP+)/methenyltetrahydrofolate cyclohydrolase